MRESMEIYPRTAAERAMKLHEVLLRASAGKIKWWQAAELVGISERQLRRWRKRLEEQGHKGPAGSSTRDTEPPARAEGEDGTGSEPVSGQVLRSERAALSREVGRGASDRVELHVGQAGTAGGRSGKAQGQARRASQAA